MRHLQRWLASALVAVCILVGLGATDAGAAAPSLVVTPDPITIHLGTATRVPLGTTVMVQVTAVDFAPQGKLFFSIAGAGAWGQRGCALTSATVLCPVAVPSLPAGTYTMTTRYQSPYAGVGPVVYASTTVIIAP